MHGFVRHPLLVESSENTPREQTMNQKNTTLTAKTIIFFLGWIAFSEIVPTRSYGATAAEVLKSYGKLSSKEREAKLKGSSFITEAFWLIR
jgi:hypothetical protein